MLLRQFPHPFLTPFLLFFLPPHPPCPLSIPFLHPLFCPSLRVCRQSPQLKRSWCHFGKFLKVHMRSAAFWRILEAVFLFLSCRCVGHKITGILSPLAHFRQLGCHYNDRRKFTKTLLSLLAALCDCIAKFGHCHDICCLVVCNACVLRQND